LSTKAADRDQALGIAEDDIDEAGDLARVRFDREGIVQRRRVVEIPPGIEMDDVVVAHAGRLQQRSAHAQNRHSKKSRTGGDARQQLARIGGPQDPHAAVGHALREIGIEGHELVVQLGRVLVDRGEQRRVGRDAGHRRFHVGLVERDLRGVDGLCDGHALGHRLAPVLRVHRLAFPERRGAQPQRRWGLGDDPVDMAADAPARDGEAELAAVAFLGHQIEPRRPQPADGEILEFMPDREDPERPAGEILALVLRRARELELQRALAGMAEPGRAEIGARRAGGALGFERGIHGALIRSAMPGRWL
jgi:hypothetical protein